MIGVLIDQKAVAKMWLRWCISCSDCPDVDLRRIRVTVEPDADLPYIKSPDTIIGLIISLSGIRSNVCIVFIENKEIFFKSSNSLVDKGFQAR